MTYPLGVVGVILGLIFLRKCVARASNMKVMPESEDLNKTHIDAFKIVNPALFNKTVKEAAALVGAAICDFSPLARRESHDTNF